MKKIVIATLLLSIVMLSACSVIQDYLPGCTSSCDENQSNESATGYVVIENPFEFTDTTDAEVVNLSDEEPQATPEEVAQEPQEKPADVLATLTAVEGDTISLADLQAEDPDGDTIDYSYSEPFTSEGMWKTEDGDEGTYLVTVTASDGVLSTSETIQVVVTPSNKGPVIDCPASLTVKEGEAVELPCTIYDKEGDEVTYTVSGFADALTFETTYDDAGSKEITIIASDGNRETTKTIALEISDVNRAPVVAPVDDITALEGDTVKLTLDANDPDGDDIEVTYPLLFDDQGNWATEKGDAGTYELEAVVSDGVAQVVVPINILVEKVNSPPTLSLNENIKVDEGDLIDLEISASDDDGDDVQVTISGFMSSETYQTTYDDAGEYEVTVTASDGKQEVSKTVTITINDVNRPPVFILK
ncbi:MAG: hypothetical protein KC535_05550 [Nanoarchaeota archaeon]|nr:hypothetical protein [Nanoarchaeota archaeon]